MKRYLFIDRDGTLIAEPADQQIDSYPKFRLIDGCIPALLALRDAGYRMVMVSNQDGLGTDSFPREDFEGPQNLLLQILESQGIRFDDILIDESFPHEDRRIDGTPSRKPGIGMLLPYLRDREVDMAGSAVIGDRETDVELARNLGCRALRIGPDHLDWSAIVRYLLGSGRRAERLRETKETRIRCNVDLDRVGDADVHTGIGFFDHMLEQLGKHGGFALTLRCDGDLHIDDHHTVEDCALTLGATLREALGERRGIARYGSDPQFLANDLNADASSLQADAVVPMDDCLAWAALDLSGRPYCMFQGEFARERVGELSTELVPHFFRSLCESAGISLHMGVRGDNAHHQVEA